MCAPLGVAAPFHGATADRDGHPEIGATLPAPVANAPSDENRKLLFSGKPLEAWPKTNRDAFQKWIEEQKSFRDLRKDDATYRAVFSAARHTLDGHLTKTFADCEGNAVEFEIAETPLKTSQITLKKSKVSSNEIINGAPSTAFSSSSVEHSFRPIYADDHLILLELPLSDAEAKTVSNAKKFLLIQFEPEGTRTVAKVRPVFLVAGELRLEKVMIFEESPMQACRPLKDHKGEPEPPKEAPPELKVAEANGAQHITAKTKAQAKAIEDLAAMLKENQRTLREDPDVYFRRGREVEDEIAKAEKRNKELAAAAEASRKELTKLGEELKRSGEHFSRFDSRRRSLLWELNELDESRKRLDAKKKSTQKSLWDLLEEKLSHKGDDDYRRKKKELDDSRFVIYRSTKEQKLWDDYLARNKERHQKLRDEENEIDTQILRNGAEISRLKLRAEPLVHEKAGMDRDRNGIVSHLEKLVTSQKKILEEGTQVLQRLKTAGKEREQLQKDYEKAHKALLSSIPESLWKGKNLTPLILPISGIEEAALTALNALTRQPVQYAWLSLRDPKTLREDSRFLVAILPEQNGRPARITLLRRKGELTPHDLKDIPLVEAKAINGKPQPITLNTYLRDAAESYQLIDDTVKDSKLMSELPSYDKMREFLSHTGLPPIPKDLMNAQIHFAPDLAKTNPAGTVGLALLKNGNEAMFASKLPLKVGQRVVSRSLGSNPVYTFWPIEVLESQHPEVKFHEWSHKVDEKVFHFSEVSEAIKPALEARFEKLFSKIMEDEMKGDTFQRVRANFIDSLPEGERDISPIPRADQEKILTEGAKRQRYGEDYHLVKEEYKKLWVYLHDPAEQFAWAFQVGYLRDVDKLGPNEVLIRMARLSGGTAESVETMPEFQKNLILKFYATKNLAALGAKLKEETNLLIAEGLALKVKK